MTFIEGWTQKVENREFRVELLVDERSGPPWKENDFCGVVRYERRPYELTSGEVVLHLSRDGVYIYDWYASLDKARVQGWGHHLGAAVQRDFDYLRAYLRGEWSYVGVRVTAPWGLDESRWGIEDGDSLSQKYIREDLVPELAGELLYDRRSVWRQRLKLARKRHAAHLARFKRLYRAA